LWEQKKHENDLTEWMNDTIQGIKVLAKFDS